MTSISVGKIGKIGEKHLTDSGVGIIMSSTHGPALTLRSRKVQSALRSCTLLREGNQLCRIALNLPEPSHR
jgi:hypothetical protein